MSFHHDRYDAIVVGARAAGASTAMLLARAGRRVLVVDRSRYGADTLSTHGLMRAGVLQLHRWGVLDRIEAAGTPPIVHSTFTLADDDRRVIPIKPSNGVDALYAPRRTVLDPILVDAAVAAGADVRFGVTMTGLRRNAAGTVSGILGHDDSGRPFSADADLVIGADGARSKVADLVDAPIERTGTAAGSVIYGYWSDLPGDGYDWVFIDQVAAGVIPTNDGQSCVFVAGPPDRLGSRRLDAVSEVLSATVPDIAARVSAARAPARVRAFPGRPGFIRRSWGPGWALVGDAGYWKDPISAHGLSDALRDAELVARAVLDADTPRERVHSLAAYQATRDRVSHELFDVTDEVAAFDWTAAQISELLIRLSASMAEEVALLAGLDAAPPADVADAVA